MGTDFLAKTKDTRRHAWNRNRALLARDDLLKRIPAEEKRTFLFQSYQGVNFDENEEIIVCERRNGIRAIRKKTEVAKAVNPSREVLDCLKSVGGWTRAQVKKIHPKSGCVDIVIK